MDQPTCTLFNILLPVFLIFTFIVARFGTQKNPEGDVRSVVAALLATSVSECAPKVVRAVVLLTLVTALVALAGAANNCHGLAPSFFTSLKPVSAAVVPVQGSL